MESEAPMVSWVFLALSVWGAWFTWNAYRPIYRPAPLAAFSFFAGWLTSELAMHHLAWQLAATFAFAWAGAFHDWPGRIGFAITLASWAALYRCQSRAREAADAETLVRQNLEWALFERAHALSARHASAAWERRFHRPLVPYALAALFRHRSADGGGMVVTAATRLWLAGPDPADPVDLLSALVDLARARDPRRPWDVRTAIANRHDVVSRYTASLKRTYKEEMKRLRQWSPRDAEILRSLKRAVLRGQVAAEAERAKLAEALKNSRALETAVAMRRELDALWDRSTASKEQLLRQLQDWCHRAETSGVAPLVDFSHRLRSYA